MYAEQTDIFINEIIKYFPAVGSQPLSHEQMDFLTQAAKTGVFVYAACQDFGQAHKQFRNLTNEVYVITKIMGSRRPIASAPPPKFIWGFCLKRAVSPQSFKGDNVTMDSLGWPSIFTIKEEDCNRFDTLYKVPLSKLPDKYVRPQRVIGKNEEGDIVYDRINWVG